MSNNNAPTTYSGAFAGASFNGPTQAAGTNNGTMNFGAVADSASQKKKEVASNGSEVEVVRVFVFIAKGHEEESLTGEALKILDWKLDPERSIGGFETWSKVGKRGQILVVDLFTVGCVGSEAVDLVTEDVVKNHHIFTTVGCYGGLPELPLGTTVPIVSASVRGRIITRHPSDYKGVDRITDLYLSKATGGLAGPIVRIGKEEGVVKGDPGTPAFQDDLLKKPQVLTTTEAEAQDGTTDFSKTKLRELLREEECAVVEMEIGLYWAKLESFSRAKEFRILPAFKGVSDNGYDDNIADKTVGERASAAMRKQKRRFAIKSASVAMLLFLEVCL